MIKRTVEISRQVVHVSAGLDQLLIQPYGEDKSARRSIPAEDIGLLMVDQNRATFTAGALTTLMKHGTAVVVCGRDHHPQGLMLPLADHTEVVWRIKDQIAASRPTLKRLWQQVVAAKIVAQADNLGDDHPVRQQLLTLSREVKTGDHTNTEAHAARLYWSAWLHPNRPPRLASSATAQTGAINLDDPDATPGLSRFRRQADAIDPLNAMLNYGYAVLRAAVARAIVSSGLFPALGLHHRHRANNFCLADDLMEPLRPLVDRRVRRLYREGHRALDQPTKARLLHVLTETVETDGSRGPLMVALPRLTASLLACYRKQARRLAIPAMLPETTSHDPDAPTTTPE